MALNDILMPASSLLKSLEQLSVADIDAYDEEGCTALHRAVTSGDESTVAKLIKAGADINARKGPMAYGLTPLQLAVRAGSLTLVQRLLNSGAHSHLTSRWACPQTTGDHSRSPLLSYPGYVNALHMAILCNYPDIVAELVGAGTSLGPWVCVDYYSTQWPILALVIEAMGDQGLDTLNLLLSAGCAVNSVPGQGSSPAPLFVALRKGSLSSAKRLLQEPDIDLESVLERIGTPLHYAIEIGHADIVETLLEVGANIQAEGCYDLEGGVIAAATPLHIAARYNRVAIADLLVLKGADLYATCDAGFTPLGTGIIVKNHQIVKKLIELGAINDTERLNPELALIAACVHGDSETVRLVLEGGPNIAPSFVDRRCLMRGIYSEFEVAGKLRYLLAAGASVEGSPGALESPLEAAAQLLLSEAVPAMLLLLSAGADAKKKGRRGMTPLQALLWRLSRAAWDGLQEAAPAIVALMEKSAGDRPWDELPETCPQLEKLLLPISRESPEKLSELYHHLEEGVQEVVRSGLRVLHHYLPTLPELHLPILAKVFM